MKRTKTLLLAGTFTIAAMLIGCGTTDGCRKGSHLDPYLPDANLEINYFEHAQVAKSQYESRQIPDIVRENRGVLILQMPEGQGIDNWVPGTTILVRDQEGKLLHKFVLYAAELADGTVGVVAREATLLSAISDARTLVDAGNPNAKNIVQQKVILDGQHNFHKRIDLSDYNINLGNDAAINWVNANIEFDFTARARLEINSMLWEAGEAAFSWVRGKVSESAATVAALLDDGKIDTEEDLNLLEQRLQNAEEFRKQVDDIVAAMEDPERIKDATVAIDGTLSGIFQPEFILSAYSGPDIVVSILPADILVPLGPIPAQVSLNASLVFGAAMSGELRLTTGVEFGAQLRAKADWRERSATASMSALDGWDGAFVRSLDPVISADGEFWLKAGLQPEIGLSLSGMLGFTVNPEIYAKLQATGSVSGNCVQLSYELLGGLDASVRGEALIWHTDEWSFFNVETSLLGPYPWASSGCANADTVSLDLGGGITMPLAEIPSGSFTMGSASGLFDEQPAHTVTIGRSLHMSQHEVTQAQWRAVMGSNPSTNQASENLPVEQVSWDDCVAFCNQLSARTGRTVRLPTEAEWEYACRAGTATAYYFGDSEADLGSYAWYHDNSGDQTHAVGGKQPNAFGLYDMYGNVREWCGDWYDVEYYRVSPSTDPSGPGSGDAKVARGGSFAVSADSCRSSDRGIPDATDQADRYKGFRVVVEAQ